MNILLAVIAVLGLTALIISAYIFAVAARNFVSTDDLDAADNVHASGLMPRCATDRRKAPPVVLFPIVLNGVVIPVDRRKRPDRRARPLLRLVDAEE